MSANLAATLFYLAMVPWVCVSIMWQVLPKLETDARSDASPAGTAAAAASGHTLAVAFATRKPVSPTR